MEQNNLEQEIKEIEQAEIEASDTTTTTIKELEAKGADNIQLTEEEWLKRHLAQVHLGGQELERKAKNKSISRRSLERVLVAAHQLPSERMKSTLTTQNEIEMFLLSQQIMNSKFAILNHYVREQAKAMKAEAIAKAQETSSETVKEETNNVQE